MSRGYNVDDVRVGGTGTADAEYAAGEACVCRLGADDGVGAKPNCKSRRGCKACEPKIA